MMSLYRCLASLFLMFCVMSSLVFGAVQSEKRAVSEEQALELGEEFGIVVGAVDQEIQEFLGLTRAEGVVVFEVIGGTPADLAGIKSRAIIKEVDSMEIKTLADLGRALKAAMPTQNFTVATYEPADSNDQGVSGGINFHFVRILKD